MGRNERTKNSKPCICSILIPSFLLICLISEFILKILRHWLVSMSLCCTIHHSSNCKPVQFSHWTFHWITIETDPGIYCARPPPHGHTDITELEFVFPAARWTKQCYLSSWKCKLMITVSSMQLISPRESASCSITMVCQIFSSVTEQIHYMYRYTLTNLLMFLASATLMCEFAITSTNPRRWVSDLEKLELLIQVPSDYFWPPGVSGNPW